MKKSCKCVAFHGVLLVGKNDRKQNLIKQYTKNSVLSRYGAPGGNFSCYTSSIPIG